MYRTAVHVAHAQLVVMLTQSPESLAPLAVDTGVAIVDACSSAIFIVFCVLLTYWARLFTVQVDENTVEVADYTVVAKGLPDTNPVEVTCL